MMMMIMMIMMMIMMMEWSAPWTGTASPSLSLCHTLKELDKALSLHEVCVVDSLLKLSKHFPHSAL